MFIYQPTFNNINVKQTNNEYNVYAWKSKGIYSTELRPLHNLAPIIAYYRCKIAFRFNYRILTIIQKSYKSKIMNIYIVYDLDACQKIYLTI